MSQLISAECNLIAVGAWNPSIIEPVWLKKQFPTLIPTKFEISSTFGTTPELRFKFEKITLVADNEKLIFIPGKMDDETLNYITELSVNILKKLEHTPIKAAGCNFVYKLDDDNKFLIDEMENMEEVSNLYKDLKLKEITSRSRSFTFSYKDYQLNIVYTYKADYKKIQYNFNYSISNSLEIAANSLKSNFKISKDLNERLIGRK